MTGAPQPIELRLVNDFSIDGCGGTALSRPARRLLAYLAVQDHRVPRDSVAFSLWPDYSEARATASLRTAIWSLGERAGLLLDIRGATLGLMPGLVVDYRRLTSIAHLLDGPQLVELLPPMSSYTGDLLPHWDEEWLGDARSHWKEVRLRALDGMARRSLHDRHFLSALEALLKAKAIEPFRESTRRLLIEAHLAEGNPARALQEYNHFAAFLREELGVDPSPALAAAVGAIATTVM